MNTHVRRGQRRLLPLQLRQYLPPIPDVFVHSEATAASVLFNYRKRSDSRLDSFLIGRVHGQI